LAKNDAPHAEAFLAQLIFVKAKLSFMAFPDSGFFHDLWKIVPNAGRIRL
jgi:hypothetical protein